MTKTYEESIKWLETIENEFEKAGRREDAEHAKQQAKFLRGLVWDDLPESERAKGSQ